jgi:hypothetical protein
VSLRTGSSIMLARCELSPNASSSQGRGEGGPLLGASLPLPALESPPRLHRPCPPLRYVHVIRRNAAAADPPLAPANEATPLAFVPPRNQQPTSWQEAMGEGAASMQAQGRRGGAVSSPLFTSPPTALTFRLQPRNPGAVAVACTPSPEQATATTPCAAVSHRGRKRPASSCTGNLVNLLGTIEPPARSAHDKDSSFCSSCSSSSSSSPKSSKSNPSASPTSRLDSPLAIDGTVLTLQGLSLLSPILHRCPAARPSPQDQEHRQDLGGAATVENWSICSPSSSFARAAPGGGGVGCHSSSFSKYSSQSQPSCSINQTTSSTDTSESTSNNNKRSTPPRCVGPGTSSIKPSPRFASLRVLSQDTDASGNVDDVKSASNTIAVTAAAHRPPRPGVNRTSTNMFYSLSSPNGFSQHQQHPETPPRQLMAPSYPASTESSVVSALQMSPDGADSLEGACTSTNADAGCTSSSLSFKQRRTNLCHSPVAASPSKTILLPLTSHTPLGGGAQPARTMPPLHHTPAASSIASSGAATASSFYSSRTPLPKLTLTPRSTGSRRSANNTGATSSELPRFPSPTAWVEENDHDDSMMLMTPSDFTIGGGVDPSPNAYTTTRTTATTAVDMSFNSSSIPSHDDALYHPVQSSTDIPTELLVARKQAGALSSPGLARRRPLPTAAASTRTSSFIPMPDWSSAEPPSHRMAPSMNSPVVLATSRSLLAPSRSPDPFISMLACGGPKVAADIAAVNNDGFLSDIDDDDDEDEGGFLLASPGAIVEEKLAAQQQGRAKHRCLRRTSLPLPTTADDTFYKRTSLSTMAPTSHSTSNTSLLGIDFLASNTSLFGLDALTKGTSSGSLPYMAGNATTNNNNFRPYGSPTIPADAAAPASSGNGGGMLMTRTDRAVSIGLAIDSSTNEEPTTTMMATQSGCCRDGIVTPPPPPIMSQMAGAFPPRLSPRNLNFEEMQEDGRGFSTNQHGALNSNLSGCQVDLNFPFESHPPHFYHTPSSA